jgi:hypothetical protein
MPPQQRLWLHDDEGLFPCPNEPGQQNQEHAIGPGERWPFHLPLEDKELLAQEHIFREQLGIASTKVGQRLQRQRGSKWFRPLSQASREGMSAAIQEAPERGQKTMCWLLRTSVRKNRDMRQENHEGVLLSDRVDNSNSLCKSPLGWCFRQWAVRTGHLILE